MNEVVTKGSKLLRLTKRKIGQNIRYDIRHITYAFNGNDVSFPNDKLILLFQLVTVYYMVLRILKF